MDQQLLLLSVFFSIIAVIQVNSHPLALRSESHGSKHSRRAELPIEKIVEAQNTARSAARNTIPHAEIRELIPVTEREPLPRLDQGNPVAFRGDNDRQHNFVRLPNNEVDRIDHNDHLEDPNHHSEDELESNSESDDSSIMSFPMWQAWSESDGEDIEAMPLFDNGESSSSAKSEVINGAIPASHRRLEMFADTGDSHRDKRLRTLEERR